MQRGAKRRVGSGFEDRCTGPPAPLRVESNKPQQSPMEPYPTLFGCEAGGHGRVVVAGLPYDRSTDVQKAGCALAPSSLRSLSLPEELRIANGELFDLARRTSLVDGRFVSDLGDLRFRPNEDDETYLEFVAQTTCAVARDRRKPLLLGGDHLITLPALRGLRRAGRIFQVVQLDAHHDYGPIQASTNPTHATFVGYVAKEELAKQVLQIGIRGLAWGEPLAPDGVSTVKLAELPAALLPDVDVYLTVDTDAFDPTLAPAVGYPEPEGLTFDALRGVLAHIRKRGLNVIGADWTEYNPRFDTTNELTGRVVLRGLALILESLAERSW